MAAKPPKTILLVEDDHDTRVVLRQSLETAGYFVFSAADGRNAIEMLRRIKPPCLILLDLMMPMMDGQEFLNAMEADPALQVIPVVVVSAYPETANTGRVKAFIQKPVDLEVLVKTVGEFCPVK